MGPDESGSARNSRREPGRYPSRSRNCSSHRLLLYPSTCRQGTLVERAPSSVHHEFRSPVRQTSTTSRLLRLLLPASTAVLTRRPGGHLSPRASRQTVWRSRRTRTMGFHGVLRFRSCKDHERRLRLPDRLGHLPVDPRSITTTECPVRLAAAAGSTPARSIRSTPIRRSPCGVNARTPALLHARANAPGSPDPAACRATGTPSSPRSPVGAASSPPSLGEREHPRPRLADQPQRDLAPGNQHVAAAQLRDLRHPRAGDRDQPGSVSGRRQVVGPGERLPVVVEEGVEAFFAGGAHDAMGGGVHVQATTSRQVPSSWITSRRAPGAGACSERT
jgi:hypothetical protein